MPTPYRRKLIEVALPLEAINKETAREKSIRHGHPSTLHLWWARRPLAACRAVLFSSLVDDPGEPNAPQEYLDQLDRLPGGAELPPETPIAEVRREKLFRFIEELVKWENSNNERVIGTARQLILAATEGKPPPVLDPFCGGGSIPLEAQRLGLEAHASDLNPVAVLITKALIEIPPKFAGQPPVGPEARRRKDTTAWPGATGLADDVRYYGQWMRDEAERRIGHLYPKAKLPTEQGGGDATVIAWLWARTVKCPNPACGSSVREALADRQARGGREGAEPLERPVATVTIGPALGRCAPGLAAPRDRLQRSHLVETDDLSPSRRVAIEIHEGPFFAWKSGSSLWHQVPPVRNRSPRRCRIRRTVSWLMSGNCSCARRWSRSLVNDQVVKRSPRSFGREVATSTTRSSMTEP